MAKMRMTPEEASVALAKMDQSLRRRIVAALRRTFDVIHSDLACAAGLEDGGAIEDAEVQREGAADYMSVYHGDPGALEVWKLMEFPVRDLILAEAFPDNGRMGR